MMWLKTAALGLVLSTGLLAGPATAWAAPTGSRQPHSKAELDTRRLCAPVHATGVGQDLGGGRTTAIISSHGLRLGATAATFTFTVPGQPGTVASFSGPIVFTDQFGTITTLVGGTLDITTGDFRSSSTNVSGSGLYQAITGSLTFTGSEDLLNKTFTESVNGNLCATSM